MRALDIWLFMVILNMCIGVVGQLNIFPGLTMSGVAANGVSMTPTDGTAAPYASGIYSDTSSNIADAKGSEKEGVLGRFFDLAYQVFFVLLPKFLGIFAESVLFVPLIWLSIGVPPLIVGLLSTIYYLIVTIAIIQWSTGRGTREYQ